jgi:hypothetical protein
MGQNGTMHRLLRALRGQSPPRSQAMNRAVVGIRDTMSRPHLSEVLSTLLERDAKLLCLFSGGLEGNYNHRSQFQEALPELTGHTLSAAWPSRERSSPGSPSGCRRRSRVRPRRLGAHPRGADELTRPIAGCRPKTPGILTVYNIHPWYTSTAPRGACSSGGLIARAGWA